MTTTGCECRPRLISSKLEFGMETSEKVGEQREWDLSRQIDACIDTMKSSIQ